LKPKSTGLDVERLAKALRGHWGVGSMHWLLDVEFKGDLSRYRSGHGAKNMAVVRRFALRQRIGPTPRLGVPAQRLT
jgi:predicted transposase YbfD/YdcC